MLFFEFGFFVTFRCSVFPQKSKLKLLPHHLEEEDSTKFIILTLISIVCIIGVLAGSGVIYCLRHRSHHKLKEKLSALGTDSNADATSTYQVTLRFPLIF